MLPHNKDYLRALSNPKIVGVGKSRSKLESQMRKYGDGARAIVGVSKGNNGHVFIAENSHGKISYIDPQTNKRYGSVNLRNIDNATVTRIDDQSFTGYARHAFTRQKV